MTRYRHRIINKVSKPIPVFFIYNRPVLCTVQQVTHANGNPVLINYRPWDYHAGICLHRLQIRVTTDDEIEIDFYGIDFECMSPNAPKPADHGEQIRLCLKRMRDGKCPYGLASQLFTGIKNKKGKK